MAKIRFTRTPEAHEGGDETMREGAVVEVSEASAERWIRRDAAERVGPEPKKEEPKK